MRLDEEVRAACLTKLRDEARTDYLTALLLPSVLRDPFLTLRAFHAEVVAVPYKVREAIAGQVRLQWWRDVIERERDVEALANPISAALLELIEQRPDAAAPLIAKMEAHEADLYGDGPPDVNALEGYAGETRSVLYALGARFATDETLSEASGHAGVAEYLAELLANLPAQRAQGRVVVPADLLPEGGPTAWLAGTNEGGETVVTRLSELCRSHVSRARAAPLPAETRGLFRPLSVFEATARIAERNPAGVLEHGVRLSALRRQWSLLRGP